MKKISYLFILSLCLLSFVSCAKDSEDAYLSTSLSVVSSNVYFTAAGGTGTIVVNASSGVTATADQPWCKVAVSGNTISVTVPELDKLEGRASSVTISSGSSSTKVTAQQAGYVFEIGAKNLTTSDTAKTLSYYYKHSIPVTLKSSADWFSVAEEGDSIHVTVAANTTGSLRTGYLKYSYGSTTDSIAVTQYDIADILGNYAFYGTDYTTDKDTYLNCTLNYDNATSAMTIDFPDYGWSIPVAFDYDSYTLKIAGGTYMGTFSTYYMYTVLWDADQGYITWSTGVTYSAQFGKVALGGYEFDGAPFLNDGSWNGYNVSAIMFYAFKAKSATSANRVGTLVGYINPMLVKLQ